MMNNVSDACVRRWQLIAAVGGLLWVVIGASAGHGVLSGMEAVWFEKAQRYHIVHVLALLWLAGRCRPAAVLWLAGMLIFSGTLYVMAFTGWVQLRWVVPVGGVMILAGWAWLCAAVFRGKLG